MRRGPSSEAARFVDETLAREQVAHIATILGNRGIEVAPLKGVLLQRTVYAGKLARPISDVDLLVAPGRFHDAQAALADAGYAPYTEPAWSSATLRRAGDRYLVDLHRCLFRRGLFELDAREVLARATPDESLFGARVLRLDPLDLYAHLVGHFVKGRHVRSDAVHIRDFAAVAEHYDLDPGEIASHLEAHGLARAARYALRIAAEAGDARSREVLTRLPRDPLGDQLASAVGPVFERAGKTGAPSAIAAHLLSASLGAAAYSIAVRSVEAAQRVVSRSRSPWRGRR